MELQTPGVTAVEEIIEQLANGVVAGPDDLMGIGETINLIERLEGAAASMPGGQAGRLQQVKQLLTRIVLESSPDVEGDWRAIRGMIGQLGYGPDVPALELEPEERGNGSDLADWMESAAAGEEDAVQEQGGELQDPELLKDFIEEAKEHLNSIELNMLTLETNPGDSAVIDDIFRPFHSIKGVAGFLNLKAIHQIAHEVEDLLDDARSGKSVITDTAIDLVLSAVDLLKSLLVQLEFPEGGTTPCRELSCHVDAFLGRIKGYHYDADPVQAPAPPRRIGEIMVDRGVLEPEVVEEVLKQSRSSGTRFGEQLIKEGLVEPRNVSLALREQRQVKESASVIRIDTQKLDNLVDMVGELVIAQSMILHNPDVEAIKDQKLQKDCTQLRRITSELQRISMSMRMVPIKSTFQKMIRLVRDLSKKSGKEVVLEMQGEETEIDRNMVEEIYEPLVHMIRNALDHGIESPEERVAAGKPAQGTVILAAEQKGGSIVIEIKDDGRGLDAAKIRAKALERGLISASDSLEDEELYELIFHPGFSTKEVVTEVSGRGVGMDVVKRSIDQLRGKIETTSVAGRGTAFLFKLPLTMAIIDGMIIQVGSERYVVPTVAMNESLRPAQEAYMTVHGRGELIQVRDRLMPLVRLHEVFGVPPRCRNPWEALVMVVGENGAYYCLLADEIIGRQEVVIKSLGGSIRNLQGISGGAILGDGKVALIIDVKGVIGLHEGSRKC